MLVQEAKLFATLAHSSINQFRKYTHDEYIVHPINVAYLVKIFGGCDEMIAASYLHDVVEDVAPKNDNFSLEKITEYFGINVALLVHQCTDKSTPEDGNREARKEIERKHVEKISKEAKTIKLADLIDNSISIVEYDRNFAKIYLREKEKLLPLLMDCSHPLIWDLANDVLVRNKKLLGIE